MAVNSAVNNKVNTKVEDAPELKLPKGWLLVTSEFRQVDPFEGTVFNDGVETPTKPTNWVIAQLAAGILGKV